MRSATILNMTLSVLAPTNDEYVGADILTTGRPFGADTLPKMLMHIKPGSYVVDAGWYVSIR